MYGTMTVDPYTEYYWARFYGGPVEPAEQAAISGGHPAVEIGPRIPSPRDLHDMAAELQTLRAMACAFLRLPPIPEINAIHNAGRRHHQFDELMDLVHKWAEEHANPIDSDRSGSVS